MPLSTKEYKIMSGYNGELSNILTNAAQSIFTTVKDTRPLLLVLQTTETRVAPGSTPINNQASQFLLSGHCRKGWFILATEL